MSIPIGLDVMLAKIFDWLLNIFGMGLGYFGADKRKPEIILDRVEYSRNHELKFILKNTGDKTALNISLGTIEINFRDVILLYYKFEKLDNLHPGEENEIKYEAYVRENNGEIVKCDSAIGLYSGIFNPQYQDKYNFNLQIEYFDSSSRNYVTHFSLGKDGICTHKITKRMSINRVIGKASYASSVIASHKYPHCVIKIDKNGI